MTKGASRARMPVRFEDAKDLAVVGSRGKAPALGRLLDAIDRAEAEHGVRLFVVDGRAVCGPAHLASAVLHAEGAAAAGERRARDEKVEVMLYLTGQRQIEKAIARAGVSKGTRTFAMAARGAPAKAERALDRTMVALGLARDDTVLSATPAKLKRLLGHAPPAGAEDLEALAMEQTAMFRVE
jgi:KEOPS complex subunit Cgi121